MKKMLCFLSAALASLCIDAQSIFVFQNRSVNGAIDAPVFDSLGVRLSGTSYFAELYGSVSSSSLVPTTTLDQQSRIRLPFATGAYAGYFAPNNAVMTVWDTVPGGWAWLQVRAWDARLGATYEDAVALAVGGYGESPVFYADGGNPLDQFPFPGPLIGLESFSLRPIIPEPSAVALLVAGSGAWWLRRRRGTTHRGCHS
jgi:hypothetical protein